MCANVCVCVSFILCVTGVSWRFSSGAVCVNASGRSPGNPATIGGSELRLTR